MATPNTYSFLDVNVAITGPGGAFSLGSGAGNAKEGITVEQNEEIGGMTVGADGSVMHSLRADKSGKVTVRLLKTSPVNAQLGAMAAAQRVSAANWGANTLSIVNKTSGDLIMCQLAAFARIPNISYAQDGDVIAWEFNVGIIDVGFGAGVQN